MQRKTFQIELLSDVILTETSATEGKPRTLDIIPGAAILGWVAGQLYNKLSSEDAFCLFHSGQVRFHDALPMFGSGCRAVPIPLSIHSEKLDETNIFDMSSAMEKEPTHPKQKRSGFVNMARECLKFTPKTKRSHVKVSLAKRHLSRRAVLQGGLSQNQLFSYESIAAGSFFQFDLQADDGVDDALFQRVCDVLSGASARLGRARKSEFGQVKITQKENLAPLETPHCDTDAMQKGGEIKFLLVSDLALREPISGQPTCELKAALFSLPSKAKIDWERSFLRKRRYTPFNGKRLRPDLERQVLSKGSVLVFTHCEDVDREELQDSLSSGVGDYREQGLGVIAVNPALLQQSKPSDWNWKASFCGNGGEATTTLPENLLSSFVGARKKQKEQEKKIFELSRKWASKFEPYATHKKGPGRSQWGVLRQISAQAKDGEKLVTGLLDPEKGFLRSGVSAHAWNEEIRGGKALEVFQELLDSLGSSKDLLPIVLQQTAARVLRLIGQKKEGGEG